MESIREAEFYVVSFDESLNHCSHVEQMDLHLRIWENEEIKSFYFNSRPLGLAIADYILREFEICFARVPKRKLCQIAQDGPNVNLSFIKKLESPSGPPFCKLN